MHHTLHMVPQYSHITYYSGIMLAASESIMPTMYHYPATVHHSIMYSCSVKFGELLLQWSSDFMTKPITDMTPSDTGSRVQQQVFLY